MKFRTTVVGAVCAVGLTLNGANAADTIKVGVLHSLSGTMAISETTLKDTMLMLVEQQNAKGGPGITRSDLLLINKVDLAPYVGSSLEVMESDTRRMRGDKPYVFCNLKEGAGVDQIVSFVCEQGMLETSVV